eukprot:CAMPEP_0176478116 /NCGR_PEP_ID=MMETSP0200_2-20121128/1011_1 /TAXON_ID=947934 /ORGANISM="Chaetoceros sp., Strain GSL56" /LENGTH=144 /DNA_ID=CAMNT_0017874025 /DNA_START=26 /DNA_END=460 /DNA_ORIENTATION=+
MARVTRSSKSRASGKSAEDPPAKAAPAITKTKLAKKPTAAASKVTKAAAADESVTISSSGKIVTIEVASPEAAFRTRSDKIVKGVGSRAKVEVNKEKPGKGNFIVTVSGVDKPIVELRGMNRPFPALKALDMEEVIQNVVNALE